MKTTIELDWFDSEDLHLTETILEDINQRGIDRVYEMISEGYHQGELQEEYYNEETNDYESIRGWWSVSYG